MEIYDGIPSNFIVVYSPIKQNISGTVTAIKTVNEDTIVINKTKVNDDPATKINFYCLMEKNGETLENWELKVDAHLSLPDTADSVWVYSNIPEPGSVLISCKRLEYPGSGDDTSKYNKMKAVTVKVYDWIDDSEPMITKESTVIEYE